MGGNLVTAPTLPNRSTQMNEQTFTKEEREHLKQAAPGAKRERAKLRRQRVSKRVRETCERCGGAGGAEAWRHTGWTCFECGGHGAVGRDRRVYEQTRDADLDEALTKIIDDHRSAEAKARWEAGAEERRLEEIRRNKAMYAASLEAWGNALEIDARFNQQEFIGDIGDKISVEGVVTASLSIEGYYGQTMLVEVTTDDGNVVKTFGSGGSLWEAQEGDTVTFSGTVKKHEVYRSKKGTVLTRAKVTAR